ncbi:MAG: hypothetical protein H6747_05350 [Deltaproteobacteria bacterium]|nr:hypothetical protein [Deltaproteobacteria bacterium]
MQEAACWQRVLTIVFVIGLAACSDDNPANGSSGADTAVQDSTVVDATISDGVADTGSKDGSNDDSSSDSLADGAGAVDVPDVVADVPDVVEDTADVVPDALPDAVPDSNDGSGLGEVVDLDANPVDCTTDTDCPLPYLPCQERTCQQSKCAFVAAAEQSPCTAGSACVTDAVCVQGVCTPQALKNCDDGNSCTDDDCTVATGLCTYKPTKTGFACEDGNKCTLTATCFSGVCIPKGFVTCDDGDPCSTDFCDPKTGTCLAKPASTGTACDDGSSCTSGDVCIADGSCIGGNNTCKCSTSADCAVHEDGNPCNGTLYCEVTSGTCEINPASVVKCPDLGQGACQITACNVGTGKCEVQSAPNGQSCDDGDPCTAAEECDAGTCKATGNVCTCLSDAECAGKNGGNLCIGEHFCDKSAQPFTCKIKPASAVSCDPKDDTYCQKNTCNPATGTCKLQFLANDTVCEDGDTCTVGDVCTGGACQSGTDTCACAEDKDCASLEDGSLCNGTLFCNKATKKCELNPATVVTCPDALDTFCTQNVCEPVTGKCEFQALNGGKACDDGNDCTKGEICQDGTCGGGTNLCFCNADADCQDDGNLCNGTPFCNKAKNQCETNPATVVSCPTVDDSLCAQNTCIPKTGKCSLLPINNGLGCDADSNNCTKDDVCNNGTCQPGVNVCQCQKDEDCGVFEAEDLCSKLYCDLGSKECKVNPGTAVVCSKAGDTTCATNACDPKTGQCAMTPQNQGVSCDADGSPCTPDDACDKGDCKAGANTCGCLADADCKAKEDGNPCTGNLVCGKDNQCVVDPATVVTCQSGSDTTCVKNLCDPADGTCKMTPQNEKAPCGNGTLCTGVALCDAKGGCIPGKDVDCDDGSPCTNDSCDDYKGCQYEALTGGACDDGSVCTESDVCVKGACIGQNKPCLGGTACTEDSCHPLNGCQYKPKVGSCDDGNKCTDSESCVGTYCVGKAIDCNDGNLCTTDSCNPNIGCVFSPNAFVCNDGDLCTKQDACSGGKCVGLPLTVTVDCADGNPCTDESCNSVKGCLWIKTNKLCDDGDPCTTGDICSGGVCQKGTEPKCDDDNGCTADACNGETGDCINLPHGPTVTCDDGNPCTLGDACSGGGCQGGKVNDCDDADPCTTDSCDGKSGCKHVAATGPACDDGNKCTEEDGCVKGKCTGSAVKCTEGNACTVDSCHPLLGCVYTPTSELCDDGNPCTSGDACKDGSCSGTAVVCNDKNACTDDSCSPKSGCVYAPNSASCDDADLCTKDDACSGGKCVGLALQLTVDCDDGIFCTDDLCGKETGCYHTKPTKPCVDDNPCTTGDTCKGGVCVGGTGALCDDGNVCTLDACVAGKCTFELPKLFFECDDGDPCTLLSRCENGECYTPTGGLPNKNYNACAIPKGNNGYNQSANFKTWWASCCGDDGSCCEKWEDRCHQKDLVYVEACKNCATKLPKVSNALSCNDNNACTTDKCVAGKGCVYTPIDGEPSCDDGKPCTAAAVCKAGTCTKTTEKICDDNNPCTIDVCEAGKGCAATKLPDGVVCEQGGASTCSTQGVCKAGTCEGATARPWTVGTTGNLRTCNEFAPAGTGWLMIGRKSVDGVWLPAWQQVRYNGTVLWERTLAHTAEGRFIDMSNDGSAGAFSAVGETKEGSIGGVEGLFARFDASQQVSNTRVFPGLKDEILHGIATTADGGHVLVGSTDSKGAGGRDGWLIRLDGKDATVWEKTDGTVVDDELYDVGLRSDGGIFAVGNSGSYAGWLLRYDKDGKQLGTKLVGDSSSNTYRFRRVLLWSDNSFSTTGNRLRTWGADLETASGPNKNNATADLILRPKGGYGWLNGATRLTDNNLNVTWTAKQNPGSQERALAPDDDSLVVLLSNNCGLVRTDAFGNTVCSESLGCYAKTWSDCQDSDLCTKNETCDAGSCVKDVTVCNDNNICTADKCDETTGKCVYTNTDGAPCSSTDSECAIAGECSAGVCYNDNVVAWQKEFLPFYGCCGDNNNASNEYQGTRLMAVAPRVDGRLFAAGPGYNRNQTNSLYGKLIAGTAGADGKYDSISGSRYSFYDRDDDSTNTVRAVDYSVAGAASFKNLVSAGLSRYEYEKKVNNSWTHDKWVTMVRLNNGNGKSVQLGDETTIPVDMEAIGDYDAASLCKHKDANKNATAVYFTRHGEASSPLGWDYQPKILATAIHHISDADTPVGLAPVDDGSAVVVAGDAYTSSDKVTRHYVARITTSGALSFAKTWEKTDNSVLKAVGWTQQGILLTGQKKITIAGTNAYFVWLRRLDSNGNLVWDKQILPSTDTNLGWSVVAKPDGFALGAQVDGKHALLRFDDAGALIGQKEFGATNGRRLEDWKALPDGFVAVGWVQKGSSYQNKWKQYGFILRTDPFGHAPCSEVGVCMGKAFSDCDDGNACTGDSCDGKLGCYHFAVSEGVTCEDGDPCTGAGACDNGTCKGAPALQQEAACDDGDPCTKGGKCDYAGTCVGEATCDDGKPCTTDLCAKDGTCSHEAIAKGAACDDGDYCTEETVCDDAGSCAGGKMVCTEKVVLEENFACSGDYGKWTFTASKTTNVTWAVDKTPAAVAPKAGDCTLNLNDGSNYASDATVFSADNGAGRWTVPKYGQVKLSFWSYFDLDATPETVHVLQVKAGNATVQDWNFASSKPSASKQWLAFEADLSGKTGDGNAWFSILMLTDSSGNSGAGWFIDAVKIVHRSHPDGMPCSFDSECNDHDPCTPDICAKGRCVNEIVEGTACQDGDACTDKDTCDAKGVCQAGPSTNCSDGDVCTDDSCDAAKGCQYVATTDGTSCDDGSICTKADSCQGGLCFGKNACDDDNPCTLNACAADGSCSSKTVLDGVACGTGSVCASGVCTAKTTTGWARGVEAPSRSDFYVALRNNGEVWGWGANGNGQLGDGSKTASKVPVQAKNLSGTVLQLAAGDATVCALNAVAGVRQVYCWGSNDAGMAGASPLGGSLTTPNLVRGSQHVRAIALGRRNLCAARMDGTAWCIGYGAYGTLGGGAKASNSSSPVTIAGITDSVDVAVGTDTACALRQDGTVACWGYNSYANVTGTGVKNNGIWPVTALPTLTDVRTIDGGVLNFGARTGDGKGWTWGGARYGSAGNGNTNGSTTYIGVTQVQGLTDALQTDQGWLGGCALRAAGTVSCWGAGNLGNLGNGALDHVGTAGTTATGLSGAVSIGKSQWGACASTSDGAVYCWGRNDNGQLGNNGTDDSSTPVLVSGTK